MAGRGLGAVAACEILDTSKHLGHIAGTQRSGIPLAPTKQDLTSTPVALSDRRESHWTKGGNGAPSFSDFVRSDEAKQLRRWIRETECHCTYECAMTTNSLFSWPLARQLYGGVAKAVVKGRGQQR